MKAVGAVGRWLLRNAAVFAAAGGLAGIVVLIVLQLRANGNEPDSTTAVLAVLALPLLFTVLAPRETGKALRRVTSFKLAGVEVGLEEIKRAAVAAPVPGEEDGVRTERPTGFGIERISERLRSRLRSSRRLLGLREVATADDFPAILAALRERGVLDLTEERLALDLLKGRKIDTSGWSAATEEEFLDAAYRFSQRFRSMVWAREVRNTLEASGWFVVDFRQKVGHRPDLLACHGDRWALLAPRVAGTGKKPEDFTRPIGERLAEAKSLSHFAFGRMLDGRVVVKPQGREATIGPPFEWNPAARTGVRVLDLATLKQNPDQAFYPRS